MENLKKKCSFKEHEKNDAISYCQECKIYMCDGCDDSHLKLYHHHWYSLDKNKNEEILNIILKEDDILIKRITKSDNYEICLQEAIKNIKFKLAENYKNIEELLNEFEDSTNKLKKRL